MFVVTVTLTFSWVPSSRADPCRCPSVFAAARYRSAAAVTADGIGVPTGCGGLQTGPGGLGRDPFGAHPGLDLGAAVYGQADEQHDPDDHDDEIAGHRGAPVRVLPAVPSIW